MISERVKKAMTGSSWIRKMFEAGALLKAQYGADQVCDFSLGNPDVPPPKAFSETLEQEASRREPGRHAYMPNGGYPEARAAIAAHVSAEQGVALTGEHLIMTCGAGGALNVALKTILDPGDRVLTSTPCFMEYRFYVDNHGGELELVPGAPDLDLDVDAFERSIDNRTAAVLVNSPNNPSGRVYPETTLARLGAMLERKSREVGRTIYLIGDEPYRTIVFDGLTVPSLFSAYKETIVATSYSKELSVPGERIGWLAVHPEAEGCSDLVNGFTLCNRILGYVNAPALMQRVVARIPGVTVDREIYQRRRDLLCDALQRIGYKLQRPQGTFYVFPEAPGGDDLAVVEALREEKILVVPGRGFGAPGYFRMSFCVSESVIERAVPGLERAYARLAGG